VSEDGALGQVVVPSRTAPQQQRLGASCDWTRQGFTLDEGPSKAVHTTFVNLYKKGLIYRGERIVNWCPRCHTALADDEVERLGRADDVAKVSLRDLGWVLSGGGLGATTVAATMHAADLAGIRVFATGGIGGVHRGGDLDVSADLTALGRIPVAVVCSGPKAVLDVARTLEALETLGVPVIGQGVDVLPEFWTRGTDLAVGTRSDDAARTAAILEAHWGCGLTTGAVVANPIPVGHELDRDMIAAAIESGLAAAATRGIRGREVTPFLLTHVAAATDGRSQVANMALVRDNAAVAGRIAVALATLHGSTEARVGSAG